MLLEKAILPRAISLYKKPMHVRRSSCCEGRAVGYSTLYMASSSLQMLMRSMIFSDNNPESISCGQDREYGDIPRKN